MQIQTNDFISTEDAAKLLELSVDTVRRYCNHQKPKIFGKKIGRDWFIPKAEIKRFLRERRTPGRPSEQP
jgi:excisionase family DNA binding protein